MSLFCPSRTKQQLRQYLNRRKSFQTSQSIPSSPINDFFVRTKYDSKNKIKKTKRFNTTPAQICQIDFRIMTFYQPSQNYKFTGQCYKTKFNSRNTSNSRNSFNIKTKNSLKFISTQNTQNFQSFYPQSIQFQTQQKHKCQQKSESKNQVPKQLRYIDIQPIIGFNNFNNKTTFFNNNSLNHIIDSNYQNSFDKNNVMTKSLLIQAQNKSLSQSPQSFINRKSSIKYKIKHPTPVKQAQFLVKVKKQFLKKHNLLPKYKSNNLIKIEEYLTQKKQQFRRKMQSELIRIGQAKLLSEIKEHKGKIYLGGLHNIKKKRKQFENIDKLLIKSRQSFSTPNKLISHMKLTSEKKHKLQNIKQLNHAKLQNCLQKIKSINIQQSVIANVSRPL